MPCAHSEPVSHFSPAIPRFMKGRIPVNALQSRLLVIGFVLIGFDSQAAAASLPFGQITTGTISSVAQSNSYTFSANAGDAVDFTMVATSGNLSPKIALYNSSGTLISSAYGNNGFNNCGGSGLELNTVALASAGAYTLLVSDCSNTNTGNYSIYAQRTNNPAGAAGLSLGGQPQTGAVGSITQSNTYILSGNANDVIDFTLVATGGNLSPKIRIYNSAGTQQIGYAYGNNGFNNCGGSGLELNTLTLPSTGTYTVLIGDCSDVNTGNYVIYTQRLNNPAGPGTISFGIPIFMR